MVAAAKHSIFSVDNKIAPLIAKITYYESLHLCLVSIGSSPFPTLNEHTFIKLLGIASSVKAKASLIKKIKADKDRNASKADLLKEIHNSKAAFDELVVIRSKIAQVVTQAKVDTIIKQAKKEPTEAKARKYIKKQAAKHGVKDHAYIASLI